MQIFTAAKASLVSLVKHVCTLRIKHSTKLQSGTVRLLYYAKYPVKCSLPFLLTFNRLKRDRNYIRNIQKRSTQYK